MKKLSMRFLSLLMVVMMIAAMAGLGIFAASAETTNVAKIGDTEYATLQEAVNKAADGDKIVLIADASIASATIDEKITIDLNKNTMTMTPDWGTYAITVNGELTIEGEGNVVLEPKMFVGYGIGVEESGKLILDGDANYSISGISGVVVSVYGEIVVNNGNFTGPSNTSLFNTGDNAKVTIYDGTFDPLPVEKRDDDTREINIFGGSYTAEVPEEWLADGCKAVSDNGIFKVVADQPVADVNGEIFYDLQEAIIAAAPAGTVELLSDVTVDEWIMFAEEMSIGDGRLITLNINGLTINGNNHTLTVKDVESAGNGAKLFHDAANLNIHDLTIECVDDAAKLGGIGLTSGTIENVTFVGGGAAIYPGDGEITIQGCTFKTNSTAIYYEAERDNLKVTGNTFELGDNVNVILLRGDTEFTGNTILSGRTVNVVSGSPVVSNNNFGNVRLKVYNAATATISDNKINVLAFNDETVVKSTFADNTLSDEAKAALDAMAVAEVGGKKFLSLQDAINAANGATITLLRDVVTEEVTISEGATVVLDLNTKTLYGAILPCKPAALTVSNGSIINNNGSYSAIEINAGTLTLTDVNVSSARHGVRIDGAVTATIDGGEYTLNATSGTRHAVNVSGGANVTIKSGTFVGPKDTPMDSGSAVCVQAGTTVTIEGGDFSKGKNNTLGVSGTLSVKGGTFDQDPTAYLAEGYAIKAVDGTYTVGEAVAKIGDTCYITLEDALKAVTDGCTVTLLDNITISDAWDCRTNGAKITASNVKINGNGKTLKLTGTVDDKNWNTVFRVEGNDVWFHDLTIDVSEATGVQRGISAKLNIAVTECTFIGNDTAKYAIIYGEGAGTAISDVEVNVVGSEFINWTYGVSDNQNAQDAKYVNIDGNTFTNANVLVSAYEKIEFTRNTMSGGYVNINSYSVPNKLHVKALNSKVDADFAADNKIVAATIANAYGFLTPVAEINGKLYLDLADAFAAAKDGNTIVLLAGVEMSETVKVNANITLDLNGQTITGTDNATGNFALIEIQPGAELTIKDETGEGKITLVAFNDRGTGNYSSVISNQRGKLTVKGGTIEHLGGTYMAYGIDNLTNGEGTYAETVVNGGTVKSTYRAIRQFLNGVEAQNILTINGGTIEGANKSVWMQDANKNANPGTLTIGENAVIKGDVYLSVTSGSTEWPVEVSIDASALDGAQVLTGNVPAGYFVENVDGIWGAYKGLRGSGIEDDPYLIGTLDQLIWFRDQVDSLAQDGSTQFAGKYFKLTANIDLAGINWNPIGTMSGDHGSFKGVFDGDNHTIYNLNVQQAGNGLGLFARTAGNAVIKNLNLHNVTVKSTDNSNYVGALVGNAYASTKINNVHVTGTIDISGRGYIGGISGHGYVVMDNVSVVGTGTISSTFWCAGGILGYGGEGTTNIMNAHVEGITITSAAGGMGSIVGMAEDNNGTQPISGSNLSAKDVVIKTYTGAYGDSYANYALGYLYGGNPTSKLTGKLSVDNVTIITSTGETPEVTDAVAQIDDAIYFDLQSAVNAGGEIKVLRNVTLNDTLTIPTDKVITLDLNDKTITGVPAEAKAYAVIINKGELTIKGEGAIVCDHKLAGSTGYAVNTILNSGKLTVNGGTIENKTTASNQIGYAIDNNSTTGNAIVVINGGEVKTSGSHYYDGIRLFCNSETLENSVTVDGGKVSSIWLQNPSDGSGTFNTKDVKGSVTITNGEVGALYLEPSTKFEASISGGIIGNVSAFQTAAGRDLTGFITGGTFSSDVSAFCATGFFCEPNGDGTYVIKNITGEIDHPGEVKVSGIYGEDSYREAYAITIQNIKGETIWVELWSGNVKLSATTLRETDRDDGTPIVLGDRITVNVIVKGRLSGSWDTEWHVAPAINNVPDTVKVYVDGKLVDEITDGAFYNEGEKNEYLALTGVHKVASLTDDEGNVSYYMTLSEAIDAANDGDIIELIWTEGDAPIAMNGAVYGKTVTITGTAQVDWHAGWLFVGRGGEGDGKLIFSDAHLTAAANKGRDIGIHVSGATSDATKNDGVLVITDGSNIELDWLVNRNEVIVDGNSTLTVVAGLNTHGRNAEEAANSEAQTATLTVKDGSTLTLKKYSTTIGKESYGVLNIEGTVNTPELTVSELGTVNINGGTINVTGTVTNNGAINVSGTTTLEIATLNGSSIELLDGAIIEASTVGGIVYVAGKVTFKGENTFAMITDYGDYYSAETPSMWTVEQGGSVTLTKYDRYGLGYGDIVTVYGSLEDALKARENLTDADAALNMYGGLVGMTNSAAPNAQNKFTAKDAYLIFGVQGDKSFGNKSGNYYGNYEFNFENCVVTANGFKFYEDMGNSVLVMTNTDLLVNGVFMTNDASSKFTFTNCVIVSKATSNGTDDKNQNAGEMILIGTSLTYNAAFTNNGTLTLGAGSTLTAPSIVGNGTIIIDATGMSAGVVPTINADASGFTGTIEVVNGGDMIAKVENGKIVLVNAVAKIGDVAYETLQAAIDAAKNGDVITLLKECDEDVTVIQAPDVKITIDGAKNTFTGTITVNGKSARYETATLTIKNVNFDATNVADSCIYLGKDNNTRYTNNVTIENCTFTGTDNTKAGIKQPTGGCLNLTIIGCEATGMHSLVQLKNVEKGLVISDCKITDCKNGISLGRSNSAVISGCEISVSGYGVRADGDTAQGKPSVTISDTTITAELPVVVRKATNAYDLTLGVGNTFTGTNDGDYQVIFTAGDDGTYEEPTGAFTFTNNGNEVKVYPTSDYVAYIGEKGYFTLADAFAAVQGGETITILAGEYTTSINVNKAINVVGETDAQGNNLVKINGGISITADGATVKNLTASNPSTAGYNCTLTIDAKDVLVEGCVITDANAMRYSDTTGKVTLKDCVLTATDAWAIHFNGSTGGEVVVDHCEVNGWIAFAGTLDKVTLKDSTFTKGNYSGGRIYNKNVEISGCIFEEGYKLDIDGTGATVTVTDSKMSDGSSIVNLFNADDACGQNTIIIDGKSLVYVAKIGSNYYETLEEALANVADWTTIKLVANATLDYNAREAYGRLTTTDIIIDGQNFTLTLNQKNSDWSSIGMANPEGKLTLKNMTIEKTGYGDTSGAWNTHAIIFQCNVEMNNVTVNNGIAVQNGATLTDVTINEAGGYYGLWINGNGQTVTVNGGAINATNGGRGIKIADEYVGTPASVTLKVDGMTFNTAKKAAVLVSSTAGADITASNYDITKVVADPVNFVWVDEDWAAHFGKVTVTGGTKAQESVEKFMIIVTDENGNVIAYYNDLGKLFADYEKSKDTVYVLLTADVSTNDRVYASSNTQVDFDFTTNAANGVTITLGYADNWNYVPHMTIGKNVTLNVPYLCVYGKVMDIYGTVNTDYLYNQTGAVTVKKDGVLNVTTGDKTIQVKNNGWLEVYGTVNAGTVNVWNDNSRGSHLIVSGANATLTAEHIHAWNNKSYTATNVIVVEKGATLTATELQADRGSSIDVNASKLNAGTLTLGYGDNVGKLTLSNNAELELTNNGTLHVSANSSFTMDETCKTNIVAVRSNANGVEVHYSTLAKAVKDAEDGDTVTLLASYSDWKTIQIGKSITLDLNGFDINRTFGGIALDIVDGTVTIVGGGKISGATTGISVAYDAELILKDVTVEGRDGHGVDNDGKLTIDGATITATEYGVVLYSGESYAASVTMIGGSVSGQYGIAAYANTTVTIEGGKVSGTVAGLSGEGGSHGTTFTVKGGEISSENGVGIYHPQNGTLTIEGDAVISGSTGINMKSGTLNVTGGTIKGTGAQADYSFIGGGFNSTGDALVIESCNYPGGAPTVSISGGTFISDYANAVASYAGNGVTAIVDQFISGGLFSSVVPEAYCAEGFVPTDMIDGYYTVMKADKAVAKIGEVYYATLADAVAAAKDGETIVLLANSSGSGIVIDKSIIIDLGSYTYTVSGETVGSTGTTTLGFQIRKDNYVTIKNGKIATNYDGCKMLIQNYANLHLTDVTLDGTGSANMQYVLSNNSGDITVDGKTNITAPAGAVAFDLYDYSSAGYVVPDMIIKTTGKITGKIEVSNSLSKNLLIYSGTFTAKIAEAWCAEGLVPTVNADGTYTVMKAETAEAKIDGVYYTSFKKALEVAVPGDIVVLLKDYDYKTDPLKIEKAITLDLGGHTLTTRARNYGIALYNGASVTNGTLNHAGTVAAIKVWNAKEISNLKIDVTGTSSTGNTIDGIVIQENAAGVDVIKNVDIYSTAGQGVDSGIKTYNCGNATEPVIGSMENVTIDAKSVGMNIYAPCGTVTNSTIKGGVSGIELWIKGTYSATLDLVNCTVEGGKQAVFAHDEFSSNPSIVNNGTLKLTADASTKFVNESGALLKLTIARAENVDVSDVQARAVATVSDGKGTVTYYATLADAVKAAEAGETVTLLKSVTLTETLNITTALTLDLNTNTITSTAKCAVQVSGGNADLAVKIMNGKIVVAEDNANDGTSALSVYDGADVTVENVALSGGYYGVKLAGYHGYPSDVNKNNLTTLVLNGGSVTAENAAIIGLGAYPNTQIDINGAEVTSTDSIAIYHPSYGTLNINEGSKITGATAIYLKAGNLNISGGEIIANGEYADYVYKYSGATATGDAVVIESCNYGNYPTPVVSITGGTFISANNKAVASYNSDDAEAVTGFISGGNFSSVVPEAYCAEGFVPTDMIDGYYTVMKADKAVAKIGDVYYATLSDAVAAAQDGDTIELLCNIKLTGGYTDAEEALRIEKAVTIKGNGYTIDATGFRKGIRVYNNANVVAMVCFENVTIVNNTAQGRCIDTRTGNISLKLSNVTLIAQGTNSQPLTIGGEAPAYRVDLLGTTIDAGKSGYGVISFVPVQAGITASSNTQINGLAAFYIKGDGTETKINLGHGTYIGTNINPAASGTFGAIVLEGSNNVVTLNIDSATVKAVAGNGAAQAAFLVRGSNNKINITAAGAQVLTEGEMAFWAMIGSDAASTTVITDNGTVLTPVAEVGGYQFLTLEEAFRFAQSGDTIKLLANATGAGIVINKSITIDFNENTYTVNGTVGSAGTTTLGFQILKGNNVTLKNGTIATNTDSCKMLIQNYANLTLTDMVLDGTGSANMQYVLSNNSGDIVVNGATSITAPAGAVAFDVYDYSSAGYTVPSMSIKTTGKITGKIEVSSTATLAISGGTFTAKIAEAWCAEGLVPTVNADGTYTVAPASEYVIRVAYADGSVLYYNDITVAIPYYEKDLGVANKLENATITLMDHYTGPGFRFYDNGMTLDLLGHTYTISKATGSPGTESQGFQVRDEAANITIRNGTIAVASTDANVKWMFNVYTDLTLIDVTVDCANMTPSTSNYVAVVQTGNDSIKLVGNTNFTNYTGDTAIYSDGKVVIDSTTVPELGKIELGVVGATVAGPEGLNVTTNIADHKVVYEGGVYSVVAKVYVAEVNGKKYESIQEAVDAAQNGETIVVLDSHELVWDGKTVIDGSMAAMVVVAGKSVIIDLNGHALTVDADKMNGTTLYAVFATDNGGYLTIDDSKDTASVIATGTAKVYSLLMAYEGGTGLTVNGGTYHLDNATSSLIYAGSTNEVVINGGKFTLGNVGTGDNGSPWIVNTYGKNSYNVTIEGGTFNADINHQFWAHEVYVPETLALKDNGNGTWTVVDAVAYAVETNHGYDRKVGYATLAEAIAGVDSGNTVTLLKSVTLTETLTIEKPITLVLNRQTITGADGAIVFNVKAETTIMNGSIKGNKSGTSSGLIDIYANLNLEGVTIETSKINALRFKAGDCIATLTDCDVTGAFKGYGGSVWVIKSGTYKASSTAISDQLNGTASVSGGTFHYVIDEVDCAPGYVVVNNNDGTYTVKYAPALFVDANNNGILDEGEAVYGNLDQVFANHKSGDVYIVLTADVVANAQVDTSANAHYYFSTNVAEGVTMNFLYTDDWNYIQKASIGENITLNAKYLVAWTDLDVYGTINTDYLYITGADVTIHEDATVNATTGDATVQVKNGAKLTVNGTLNAATLNVWAGASNLTVSGENAKVTASWIDIWDGTPSVTVENGATLDVDGIKASRGGSITVDNATLTSDKIELGHNGESAGTMTVTGNSTVSEIKLTVVGSAVTGPEGLTVTTDIADHKVVYENGVYSVVAKVYVAEVNGVKYESIREAVNAAQAGDIVMLIDNVTENVTIDKNITIDGDEKQYTGTMTVSSGKTVTIENVNFVKGCIDKAKGTSGTLTVKNCDFDGVDDSINYAVTMRGGNTVVLDGCTVKNYGYGMLYVPSAVSNVTVKNTFVDGVNYGVHVAYGNKIVIEDVTMTNVAYGIMTQNYGAKTITIKNSSISGTNPIYVWERNTTVVDTFVFEGENTVSALTESAQAKLVLKDVDSKLTAPAGYDVTSGIDGYVVEYSDGAYKLTNAVVKNATTGVIYGSLAEAIAEATAGDTIVLLTNVTEDVTISMNLTIDGAEFNYTGTMTVSSGKTVTIENVNFVKGCIDKAKGTSGTLTVKNCNFDGVDDSINYAVTMRGGNTVVLDGCTVKNYGYGMLYVPSAVSNVTVKNTIVRGVNYGVHVAYGNKVTLENVTMTNVAYGIMTQNYGAKTITIKNSSISGTNPIYVWERNTTVYDTFNFVGANTFGTTEFTVGQQAKLVLTEFDATLTACADLNVTTNVDGYKVIYANGVYSLVECDYVAQIGDDKYESIQEAVDAAQDGAIITVIEGHELVWDGKTVIDGSMAAMVVVAGKSVTIDLNGHALTVDADKMNGTTLYAVFAADENGHLTMTGNGSVTATGVAFANSETTAYCLMMAYEPGTSLTIESGVYTMESAHDSLIYSGGDDVVTVEGGTFYLGNVGDGTNGKPWIFNALGSNDRNVIVTGGTFNADINHQFWANEVYVPETKALKSNGDDTWTVVDAVAYTEEMATSSGSTIRKVGYATFAEAYAAADEGRTITLLTDVTISSDIENAMSKNVIVKKGEHNVTVETGVEFTAGTYDWDVNEYCADSHYARDNGDGTWTVVEKFEFAGHRVVFGNSFQIDFVFDMNLRDDWNGYYVEIVRTYGDGRPDEIIRIPASEWVVYGNKYMVSYDHIAAKEMNDKVSVTVYNANGVAESIAEVTSIKDYAMINLEKKTETTEAHEKLIDTLIVDMLNYGSEAQKYFGYDSSKLANADLTDEQKALATKSTTFEDNRDKSGDTIGAYYNSATVFTSNIQLQMAFNPNLVDPNTMYAVFTYTDHYGRDKTVTVDGSDFTKNGSFYVVTLETVVVSDARSMITCTIYDADGNSVTSVKDSLESYVARAQVTTAKDLVTSFMKFADSTYAYMHKNDSASA